MKMFNEYCSPVVEILSIHEDIVRTSIPTVGGDTGETPLDPNPFSP